jgi:curved DNA-binding protein CbpA
MQRDRDAYRVLQVDPCAEEAVVHAAYRALARIYHPDGTAPDAVRMAEINWAHDQLRLKQNRQAYDRSRKAFTVGREPRPTEATPPRQSPTAGAPAGAVLDFGRYAGVSIHELAKRDPDYLRWLCRHSSGLRFRAQIQRVLPPEPDLMRRANFVF